MFPPGDSIGLYTLVRPLGRGAFGEMWLAERRSSILAAQVALKLPVEAHADADIIRQQAKTWLQASGQGAAAGGAVEAPPRCAKCLF